MANKYAQGAINWSGTWYDAASGGSTTTKPVAGDTAYTNGQNVTLDENPTCTLITASTTGGTIIIPNDGTVAITAAVESAFNGTFLTWGTGTCALTITGNVTYSSTATGGMLTVGNGQTLTVNGTVTVSAAGYAIVASGTGVFVVSNVGGNALNNTSTGRCISSVVTSTTNAITGTITASGTGSCLWHQTGAGTCTIASDCSVTSTGTAVTWIATGSTLNISGKAISGVVNLANGCWYFGGGTVNWTGTVAIGSAEDSMIILNAGTLNCGTGTGASAVVVNNAAGRFVLMRKGGTLTTTNLTINNTLATSNSTVIGQAFTISGPTIPAAGDVQDGVANGFSGSPATGTFVVPAIADVWFGSGGYGAGGTEFTPAMRASDITVTGGDAATLTAPDIVSGVVVDDVTGSATGGASATDIVDAWATASQADPTRFHVNVMEVNSEAATPATAPPTAAQNATAVRAELATELAYLDAPVSEAGGGATVNITSTNTVIESE